MRGYQPNRPAHNSWKGPRRVPFTKFSALLDERVHVIGGQHTASKLPEVGVPIKVVVISPQGVRKIRDKMFERSAVPLVLIVRYWQGRRVWGTASAKPFTCQQSAGRKLLLLLLEGASASAAASAMATLPVAVTTAIGVRSVEFNI